MGINISVEKLIKKEKVQNWSNMEEYWYKTEDQDWFNSTRFSGDSDFADDVKFEELDQDSGLLRPVDFKKARLWVEENVNENCNHRLLNALNKMEKDNSLYFSFSR